MEKEELFSQYKELESKIIKLNGVLEELEEKKSRLERELTLERLLKQSEI